MSEPNEDILADFIAEANELLEQADANLLQLEKRPGEKGLLNSLFRAIHTIKGSSSFLDLGPLTKFAHKVEEMLNALRTGRLTAGTEAIDALLASVDVMKRMVAQVAAGKPLEADVSRLIATLDSFLSEPSQEHPRTDSFPSRPRLQSERLQLDDSRRELLGYFVDDLRKTLSQLRESLALLVTDADNHAHRERIRQLTADLNRVAGFFELEQVQTASEYLNKAAKALADNALAVSDELIAVMTELLEQMEAINEGLADALLRRVELQPLLHRLQSHLADSQTADETTDPIGSGSPPIGKNRNAERPENHKTVKTNQTIRVDVRRLEKLMNLVGELVLQKNHLVTLANRFKGSAAHPEMVEALCETANNMEILAADMQLAVTQVRMQPLAKVFNKYPRLVRELARETGKQIELELSGTETEVDKTVLEKIADPLLHLIRNACDHGIELPSERVAAGKDPTGRIELKAFHEDNNVVVQVSDDGRGLEAEKLKAKAVEHGMVTAQAASLMSEKEAYQLVFEPGFSTAEAVSDISGRGVGMDVVRTNIEQINGIVELDSTEGAGTTVTIRIPLTLAITKALLVRVGQESFAIPLSSVLEIVSVRDSQIKTIDGQEVLQLRNSVLPLADLAELLDVPLNEPQASRGNRYVIVVAAAEKRLGLKVTGLIGQQEVVIKPLEETYNNAREISGASILGDGSVILIINVAELMKTICSSRVRAGTSYCDGRSESPILQS